MKPLIAKGHRRIAYLTLSPRLEAMIHRKKGYHDAEEQLLRDALDRLLSLPETPTVICFGNDRMAMRAYGILRSRGVSLPDDMSVAGYDNHKMITQTLYPTLMSAELPYAAIGIRATEMLLDMINNTSTAQTLPLLVSDPVTPGNSVRDIPTSITKISSIGRTTK